MTTHAHIKLGCVQDETKYHTSTITWDVKFDVTTATEVQSWSEPIDDHRQYRVDNYRLIYDALASGTGL